MFQKSKKLRLLYKVAQEYQQMAQSRNAASTKSDISDADDDISDSEFLSVADESSQEGDEKPASPASLVSAEVPVEAMGQDI